MITNVKTAFFVAFILAASFAVSCTAGLHLNTRGAQESEIKGTYRVILYGCNFTNDLETIAFLDKEGDEYTFEPYAPDFQYRVIEGVPAKEALEAAEKFVRCNSSFRRTLLSSITAPNGAILGYEVRPLYFPLTYGLEDVLDNTYAIRGDKVVITIRLLPAIQMMLQGGGGEGKDR